MYYSTLTLLGVLNVIHPSGDFSFPRLALAAHASQSHTRRDLLLDSSALWWQLWQNLAAGEFQRKPTTPFRATAATLEAAPTFGEATLRPSHSPQISEVNDLHYLDLLRSLLRARSRASLSIISCNIL